MESNSNRYVIRASKENIPDAVAFAEDYLSRTKVSKKTELRAMLTTEEILGTMIDHAEPGSEITIVGKKIFGNIELEITGHGECFGMNDLESRLMFSDREDMDDEANDAIHRLMTRLMGDSLSIHHNRGTTKANVLVKKSGYTGLIYTIAALILGILTGYLLQVAMPAAVGETLTKYAFTPVFTVFMNALKMIVAPLVFFSVASSIADFSDIKALGRIAVRIVGMYLCTSVLAILVGYTTISIFPIGDPALADAVVSEEAQETIAKSEAATVSIKDTLVGIVPSDIITPFQESNMLQLIFMSVILGLAAASISQAMPQLRDALVVLNKAFSKITAVLVRFIPVVVFCSMAKMMTTMDLSHLKSVLSWVPVVCVGDVLMIVVYLVILALFGRINPAKFLQKYYPAMIAAFTLSSSNAALPSSMKQCDELGIPKRIYSLSLPLGATINMDGSCITLMITALFFARIFGVPVSGSVLTSLFITIMVLSVGSPGVPGGNLVCIALLIPQIGIPAEAVSLVMGLYPIVSMMQTCTNVTGDAVVTAVVSRYEEA